MSFRLLAQAAEAAYERMAPAMQERMAASGAAEGKRLASLQGSTMLSTGSNYASAIAAVESGGNYGAIGPETGKGRAYGKYQVMDFNVGPWTEKHLGRRMTPEEFLKDPAAQDAVFNAEFGSYVQKYGNPQDAASVWFSGRPMAQAGNASDGYTTVPEYVQKFTQNLTPAAPEVVVRTADGKLEPRMFSPYSGPILQAHNVAAKVAYNAEMLEKGTVDLLSIATANPLNPEAFEQQAASYIDQMVENAPDDFKMDLRATLEKAAGQRFLGMVEEKHRDIRQRAANSSTALMNRYSDTYAQAIAAGSPEEAEAARAELEGILLAREQLPGLSWTREQSQNALLDAEARAQRLMEERAVGQRKELNGQLDVIIKAHENGMTSQFDAILDDPVVAAIADGEKFREAQAYVALTRTFPELFQLPPAQAQAAVTAMGQMPVGEEFEVDVQKAADKAVKANMKAFDEDPVARAQEVLVDPSLKPVALPQFDPGNMQPFMDALASRIETGENLYQQGYSSEPAYLTNDESEALSTFFGRTTPVEARVAGLIALVGASGEAAGRLLSSLNVDPVTRQSAQLLAYGGPQETVLDAMRGQELLDGNQVRLPGNSRVMEAYAPDVAAALYPTLGNAGQAMEGVMQMAQALYAAAPASKGLDPTSPEAQTLMEKSVQKALGQTVKGRYTYGGVQTIGGNPTLLPMNVAGEKLEEALNRASGGTPSQGMALNLATGLTNTVLNAMGQSPGGSPEAWSAASPNGTPPMVNGSPLPRDAFTEGAVTLVPVNGTQYRMVWNGIPVTDTQNRNYVVDVVKLIDETRRPPTPLATAPSNPVTAGGATGRW